MAGAVQSILASPVEMFKIRMQGQYGKEGKKLREVVGGMYREWGWKRGIMRGFWVSLGIPYECSKVWNGLLMFSSRC